MGQFVVCGSSLVSWLAVLAACSAVEASPRASRVAAAAVGVKAPLDWPRQLEKRWQVEVGHGQSTPLVSEGKVYVFSRRGDDEVLTCLSASDGKELWRQSYSAPFTAQPGAANHDKGPKGTPVAASGRVFTLGIGGVLTCWDAKTGKRLWQRDFAKQFEKMAPLYSATTPVIDDEKCIVHVGGHESSALVAVDVKSGESLWNCPEEGVPYASPIVTTLDRVRQVVTQSQKACIGVEVDDGKPLWKIPFQTEYDQNAVTPIAHEGSIVFSGVNKGVDRYRIGRQDDEWETDKIWDNKEVSMYMSSAVTDGELMFGFSHRQKGQLFAIDLTTGKTLWTSDGRLGDNASLVETGPLLWALTTGGELIVFKASDKQFEPLARYKVADTPTWSRPVILPSAVLIKDETHLTLWDLPKAEPNRSVQN